MAERTLDSFENEDSAENSIDGLNSSRSWLSGNMSHRTSNDVFGSTYEIKPGSLEEARINAVLMKQKLKLRE